MSHDLRQQHVKNAKLVTGRDALLGGGGFEASLRQRHLTRGPEVLWKESQQKKGRGMGQEQT